MLCASELLFKNELQVHLCCFFELILNKNTKIFLQLTFLGPFSHVNKTSDKTEGKTRRLGN